MNEPARLGPALRCEGWSAHWQRGANYEEPAVHPRVWRRITAVREVPHDNRFTEGEIAAQIAQLLRDLPHEGEKFLARGFGELGRSQIVMMVIVAIVMVVGIPVVVLRRMGPRHRTAMVQRDMHARCKPHQQREHCQDWTPGFQGPDLSFGAPLTVKPVVHTSTSWRGRHPVRPF